MPQGDHREVFRHFPRQGVDVGVPEDGKVLRLPRRARHSSGGGPALASQPEQHRRHLRQVPRRVQPAVRRLPDPRHPPRSEPVPVPVLHLLGHDRPAGGDAAGLRPSHRDVAAAIARIPAATQGGRSTSGPALCAEVSAVPAKPAPDGDLQLSGSGAVRHDAEVLLRRLGEGPGPPDGRIRGRRPVPPLLRDPDVRLLWAAPVGSGAEAHPERTILARICCGASKA